MPNLPGRYEHSINKGEAVRPEVVVVRVETQHVACLGGCGASVAPGQKCQECAAAAVDAWLASRQQR